MIWRPASGSNLLKGLHSLLYFYLPALFSLGYKVRKLAWEGRVGGSVRGDLAREVLEQCLALHIQLLGDWDCKAEYTRTLSVALLCWQPTYSALPGCCFVEESCEAMLSRMVGRCRANYQLSQYEDVLRLFVSMTPATGHAPGTRGALRQPLVFLFTRRVQRLLAQPSQQPFAQVVSSREAVWQPSVPHGFSFPNPLHVPAAVVRIEAVMQKALTSVTGRGPVTQELRSFADANIPKVQQQRETSSRQFAFTRVRQWGLPRTRPNTEATSSTSARSTEAPVQSTLPIPTAQSSEDTAIHPPAQPTAVHITSTPPPQPAIQSLATPFTVSSEGGSIYEPPPTEDAASAGYESFGDTDSLGSAGDLVGGREADWSTLEEEGLFDYLADVLP